MPSLAKLMAVLCGTCVLVTPATAQPPTESQEAAVAPHAEGVPRTYVSRGLTLPAGTRRFDLAPPDRAFLYLAESPAPAQGLSVARSGGETLVDLRVGMGLGLAPGLELGALLFPFAFSPKDRPNSGNLQVYGRFQFLEGPVQLAAHVGMTIPILTGSDVGLNLALPVRIELLENLVLNTGLGVPLTLEDDDTVVGLDVPVEVAVNATPSVFVGIATGLSTTLHADQEPPSIIPVGLFVGTTLDISTAAWMDVQLGFRFTQLFGFGDEREETVDSESYQLTVGATLYFDRAHGAETPTPGSDASR